MKIRDIIESKGSKSVFTIPDTATLTDLVNGAKKMKVGAFLVTNDSGELTGIVSERDVMYQCATGLDFDNVTVGEIMTEGIISADEDDGVSVAMDLMAGKKIRHLAVLSGGEIRGMITPGDLIYAMLDAEKDEIKEFVEYLQEHAAANG